MQLYIQFFFLKALIIQGWNIYCVISGVVVNGFTVILCNLRARRRSSCLIYAYQPRPGLIGGGPHPRPVRNGLRPVYMRGGRFAPGQAPDKTHSLIAVVSLL